MYIWTLVMFENEATKNNRSVVVVLAFLDVKESLSSTAKSGFNKRVNMSSVYCPVNLLRVNWLCQSMMMMLLKWAWLGGPAVVFLLAHKQMLGWGVRISHLLADMALQIIRKSAQCRNPRTPNKKDLFWPISVRAHQQMNDTNFQVFYDLVTATVLGRLS